MSERDPNEAGPEPAVEAPLAELLDQPRRPPGAPAGPSAGQGPADPARRGMLAGLGVVAAAALGGLAVGRATRASQRIPQPDLAKVSEPTPAVVGALGLPYLTASPPSSYSHKYPLSPLEQEVARVRPLLKIEQVRSVQTYTPGLKFTYSEGDVTKEGTVSFHFYVWADHLGFGLTRGMTGDTYYFDYKQRPSVGFPTIERAIEYGLEREIGFLQRVNQIKEF